MSCEERRGSTAVQQTRTPGLAAAFYGPVVAASFASGFAASSGVFHGLIVAVIPGRFYGPAVCQN